MVVLKNLTLVWCILAATLAINAADRSVPRQIKQIYKQYKRRGVQEDGINTVRYIRAHQGSLSSQRNLLFDLDSIEKSNETVIKAELHFYRRSTEEMQTIQIEVSEVSAYYVSLAQRERLTPTGKGWQRMDISISVKRCTNTIKTNNKLGIGFSNVNKDLVAVPVNIPQFLRHHGFPFILIYSNNTRTLEMDQIEDQSPLTGNELVQELDTMINPKTGKARKPVVHRERRDVLDNKIDVTKPDMEPLPALDDLINPDDLFNELTNIIEPNEDTVLELPTDGEVVKPVNKKPTEKIQYIPWPNLDKIKKKKKIPKERMLLPITNRVNPNRRQSKGCERKSLRIALSDIGWGDRVLEPKKFDAYYCGGECTFPYTHGRQLTNHATLQSLITTINTRPDVPQPCCVPKDLSAITLMFYDKYKNIVVKSYPEMSVESCVCR